MARRRSWQRNTYFPPDTVWRWADSLKYWANSACELAVWLQIRGDKNEGFFLSQHNTARSIPALVTETGCLFCTLWSVKESHSTARAEPLLWGWNCKKFIQGFLEQWFWKCCSYSYLNGTDLIWRFIMTTFWWQQCPGKKCSCKAEWRKVGTTVPISPCVPVILCALCILCTYADSVIELKWWMKVVVMKGSFWNCGGSPEF